MAAWEVFAARSIASRIVSEQDALQRHPTVTKFLGSHELSASVFTSQGRTLSAQASRRAGAIDAVARGKAVACGASLERGILCAACHARRASDCGSLVGPADRLWSFRRALHLQRAA